jgi:hypothetical protein
LKVLNPRTIVAGQEPCVKYDLKCGELVMP